VNESARPSRLKAFGVLSEPQGCGHASYRRADREDRARQPAIPATPAAASRERRSRGSQLPYRREARAKRRHRENMCCPRRSPLVSRADRALFSPAALGRAADCTSSSVPARSRCYRADHTRAVIIYTDGRQHPGPGWCFFGGTFDRNSGRQVNLVVDTTNLAGRAYYGVETPSRRTAAFSHHRALYVCRTS